MWTRVREWTLWTLPRRVVAYVLGVQLLVLLGFVGLVVTSPAPSTADWPRLAALVGVVVLHSAIVRRAEENLRDASLGPHIDLSSVWTFAAVIVLPGPLAVAVVVLLRVLLQPIARRLPHRFLFSSAAIVGSAMVAHQVVRSAGGLLTATAGLSADLALVAVLAAAAIVYWAVQAFLVGGAMKLSAPDSRWTEVLGSREDNLLEMITLGGGTLLGLVMIGHWAAPLLAVLPVSVANQLLQTGRARRVHLERLLREQTQLREQLVEDAHTDFRTGLLNSQGLAERAELLVRHAQQVAQDVTVLVLDLDHFKRINDAWGHPAGNAVLAGIGRLLRERLRPGDLAGRDGGEEFVVVLADTGLAAGVAAAERIREAIAELTVLTTDKYHKAVTLQGRGLPPAPDADPALRAISASIGVAEVGSGGLAAAQQAADAALYEAKEGGRNQVRAASSGRVVHIPPPSPPGDGVSRYTRRAAG